MSYEGFFEGIYLFIFEVIVRLGLSRYELGLRFLLHGML